MESCNQTVAVALLCVLAMTVASSASSRQKIRILLTEEKGDGKANELQKVSPSTLAASPPKGNSPASSQSPPPKPDPSSLNSKSSDSASPKSPSVSTPSGLEDKNRNEPSQGTSKSPPKKEVQKAPEAPNKGDHTIIQAPAKEIPKAPQAPENDKAPPAQVKDKVSQPHKEDDATSTSGKSDDSSKKEKCNISDASTVKCQNGMLVACLLQAETESKDLFLLVQNLGADELRVNVTFPDNLVNGYKMLDLPKLGDEKVTFKADNSRNLKIVLKARNEDCILQTKQSISNWRPLQQIPAYAAQVRPMHGAYFLLAIILFVGGSWACCKFGKRERRVDAGIPYQQLEMASQTQSISVANNEISSDNWDQSWDDDWDDEEAVVRTSGKRPTESVSSNGLSSRSPNPNKHGWDIDWDE